MCVSDHSGQVTNKVYRATGTSRHNNLSTFSLSIIYFRINVNLNCFVAAKYHKCGKCERLFADEETLKTNMKNKHPNRNTITALINSRLNVVAR